MKGFIRHPYVRAMLDLPALFTVVRYPIVGRQRRTRELIHAHLDAKAGERVLDICCGLGEFAGEVSSEYLGIDLNPRFIEAAARRWSGAPRKSFRVMDALRMDLPDRHFDRTMWINGLHHFSDEDAAPARDRPGHAYARAHHRPGWDAGRARAAGDARGRPG